MKLRYHDQSDRVLSVIETRKNNNVTEHTSAIYIENNIKLLWSIRPGVVYDENKTWQCHERSYKRGLCQIGSGVIYDENQTGQRRDQSIGLVYAKIEIEFLGPIWLGALGDEN